MFSAKIITNCTLKVKKKLHNVAFKDSTETQLPAIACKQISLYYYLPNKV